MCVIFPIVLRRTEVWSTCTVIILLSKRPVTFVPSWICGSCAIANNGCYSSFPLVFDNVRHALIFEHMQIGVFCLFFDNIFLSFYISSLYLNWKYVLLIFKQSVSIYIETMKQYQ